MKRIFAMLALGTFLAAGIVGCEASGRVGDDDADGSYTKKTTTVREADGDRSVRTEVRTNND